uniref:Uncharacterized protein n=1 Tax=Periophthalmus magnuspinnatus TaxID=409849 RepID=A0A3B4A745_9GOBI
SLFRTDFTVEFAVFVTQSDLRLITTQTTLMYQCMSDLECREGSYCHSSPKGGAHSRCHSCRRRKRRCHRDGMCCPGNHCSNNICVANADSYVSQRIPDSDGGMSSLASKKSWRRRGRGDMKGSAGKGEEFFGDPCLRSTDCSDGLCCARHFWTRICKPVLREGQVCTKQRRKGTHGLELFQRCSCGNGLTCRTLKDAKTSTTLVHRKRKLNSVNWTIVFLKKM